MRKLPGLCTFAKVCSRATQISIVLGVVLVALGRVDGQSSDISFPTRLTKNEIKGTIPARPIGDARLTTHYFAFEGDIGDIFISAVTQNFTGDIDVFIAGSMRPLTKMVIYASDTVYETGRLVYLRKPEKLILRVQGRTPNDASAAYQIKFAGSFVALKPAEDDVKEPKIAAATESRGGEIPPSTGDRSANSGTKIDDSSTSASQATSDRSKPAAKKPAADTKNGTPPDPKKNPAADSGTSNTAASTAVAAVPPSGALGGKIVITFLDGKRVEAKVSDIVRMSVDKGYLTLIVKDGRIERWALSGIQRVEIQ